MFRDKPTIIYIYSIPGQEQNKDFVIYDGEDGFIKSLDDIAAQSVVDEKETKPEVKDTDAFPKAPDGGYGWVVCSGLFINNMIFGGLARSEGLFFLQFQSTFGTTAQLAAWPGSLMATLNLFMGPACGAVVNRYSVRTAVMIATSLCFAGMLLDGFAPNIYFLFLSHSVFGGIGRGLMSGILLLNLYFDKHRSIATGLAMSGVGIGTLWVVPLTQHLFEEYGFTGAFLILSAIILHCFLVAMLFRPLRLHYLFRSAKQMQENAKSKNAEDIVALTSIAHGSKNNFSATNLEDNLLQNEMAIIHEDSKLRERTTENEPLLDDIISADNSNASNVPALPLPLAETTADGQSLTHDEKLERLESKVEDTPVRPKATQEKGFLNSSLKICFPIEFKRQGQIKKVNTFNWQLLKHVHFMMFCVGNFFFILAHKTAFIFLPAIAMSKGLSRSEAALLLTISGVMDTFGRIATGFIMDFRPLRPFRPYFFNFFLFSIAAASLVMPSLTTFASFCVVCAVYGFMTGAFIAQKYVVLVDILGREMMPSSLGIQKMFQGFGTLIGPPLAGALRDVLGSYDSSFYLGGASMIGAGLMLSLSSIMLGIRTRKSQSQVGK